MAAMRRRASCVVGAVAVFAALGLAREARADEESDKIREIEGYLGDIKGYLDGIAGDSSYSDIDYALDRASKVKELAERLRSLGPQTDSGKTMANYYPDWVEKFKESTRYLKEMKQAQLRQNDGRLWEKCKDAQNRLKDEIRRYTDRNDPSGMQKIPELAERAAYDQRDSLRRQEDTHREMERWYDYSRRFSETHGRWSDVKGELHDGANDLWDSWKRRREETLRECGDLMKGKENPVAVEALKQLAGNDEVRKGLIRDVNQYLRDAGSSLDRVFGDSSPGYVDDAISKLDRVKDLLSRLNYAKGEDEEAKRIADKWPGWVDRAKQSCGYLRELKLKQTLLDTAPDKCREKIEERGNALSKSHKGAGRDAIKLAEEIGKELRRKFEVADAMRSEVANLRSKVRDFSEREGAWEGVSSKMSSTAEAIESYWLKAYQAAHDKCDDVALGEKATKFLEKLQGKCTKNEQIELDKPVDQYCKQEGPFSCKPESVREGDCDELRKRAERGRKCQAAREELNVWCHDNNDANHRDKADEAKRAAERCEERIRNECR